MNAQAALEGTEQVLAELMKQVNKKYGDMSLYYLGQAEPQPVTCIPTGSMFLDLAIGHGERFMGIPFGRITEIWGPKECGKTTLCHHIIANAQKLGYPTAFFDYEHSFDEVYAEAIGVDLNKLLFGQYTILEDGWEVIEALIRSVKNAVVVVDSVAMMVPRKETEGEMGDSHVGLQPRLLAQAMRRNVGAVREHNAALIITNQVRHKIGGWGRSETQAGGEALRHALSLQINLWPSTIEKAGEDIVAREIKADIVYSKIAKPHGSATYRLQFGTGIDSSNDLVELAPVYGVVGKRGSHYYYPPENESSLCNGAAKLREWLQDNPEEAAAIRQAVVNAVNQQAKEAQNDA